MCLTSENCRLLEQCSVHMPFAPSYRTWFHFQSPLSSVGRTVLRAGAAASLYLWVELDIVRAVSERGWPVPCPWRTGIFLSSPGLGREIAKVSTLDWLSLSPGLTCTAGWDSSGVGSPLGTGQPHSAAGGQGTGMFSALPFSLGKFTVMANAEMPQLTPMSSSPGSFKNYFPVNDTDLVSTIHSLSSMCCFPKSLY